MKIVVIGGTGTLLPAAATVFPTSSTDWLSRTAPALAR
jgi:hypothetical protein